MNLANVWEAIADRLCGQPALIHAGVPVSWRNFEDQAARVASHFESVGVGPGSKVALYLYNCTEYAASTFAAFKRSAVPVNVNYRYLEAELEYLLDNSDAEAVVVSVELLDRLAEVIDRVWRVATVIAVGDAEHVSPELAYKFGDRLVFFDEIVAANDPAGRRDGEMSDLWFLYTGGTTGMPKGVMWPHSSLLDAALPTFRIIGSEIPRTPAEAADVAGRFADLGKSVRMLAAAPLMHGTSGIPMLGVLSAGGCIVTLESKSLDAAEMCEAIERDGVGQLNIVGDAFAKPIVAELDRAAGAGKPWDLSSLKVVVSSGTMWSREAKEAMLAHCDVVLADLLGSSEGTGMAASVSKRNNAVGTARFSLGENSTVLTDDGRTVEPGSGEQGVLAVGGPIPIGYYKDPEKTAATFREVGGRIWSIPGDHATVEADGTITLLGRGSACTSTRVARRSIPRRWRRRSSCTPQWWTRTLSGSTMTVGGNRFARSYQSHLFHLHLFHLHLSHLHQTGRMNNRCGCTARNTSRATSARSGFSGFVEGIRRGPNGKPDYAWARDQLHPGG